MKMNALNLHRQMPGHPPQPPQAFTPVLIAIRRQVMPPPPLPFERPPSPAQIFLMPPEIAEPEMDESFDDEPEAPEPAEPFRKLTPESGAVRLVPFGHFKALLSSQLTAPNRLRDSHRLNCRLEIFEALQTQPIEKFVKTVVGENAGPLDLQPLTATLFQRFDLSSLFPPATAHGYAAEHGTVQPGQRFFRLTVLSDPTVSEPEETKTDTPKGIPAGLLRPWEFKRSREEAIERLLQSSNWRSNWLRPLRRKFHSSDFRKWQLLLSGKSIDEQLWSVPPPTTVQGDPALRAWAVERLTSGGYDPESMASEWEIFWARKAV